MGSAELLNTQEERDAEQVKWFQLQQQEIQSPFNCWVTGIEVGHSPNEDECCMHYVRSGRAKELAQLHGRDVLGAD